MSTTHRLSGDEFHACFDRFTSNVFRLETLQHYAVPQEDASFQAFRTGGPRPERSVRTSPWLARIAASTVEGKTWQRIHVVDQPITEYLRFELVAYVESQAAGEEIRIVDRASDVDLADLTRDFWLFDVDTNRPYVVLMDYGTGGQWLGATYTTEPDVIHRCRWERGFALTWSVSLNMFLAEATLPQRASAA